MAKTAKKPAPKQTPNRAVATRPTTAPSTSLRERAKRDAGKGLEGAGRDDFAIPFVNLLQKGSPQVDETHPAGQFMEGAKAGQFFETVSKSLHETVEFVQCAYKRKFIRWGPRGTNEGGFKGEYQPEAVAKMRADGIIADVEGRTYFKDKDGGINPKKCDILADTREHYILLLDGDGRAKQSVMSLTSTQIKKSRNLNSAIADAIRVQDVPSWMVKITATSSPESNDKGSWFGVNFEIQEDLIDSDDVYDMGHAFNEAIEGGKVRTDYQMAEDQHSDGGGDQGGKF